MGKAKATAMPQSIEECAQAIAAYSEVDRKIEGLQALQDQQIAAVTATIETQAAPLREERDRIFKAVQSFCETRRKELCKGKSKSHKFTTGVVSWRQGKLIVSYDETKEKLVLNQLIAKGLSACYSTVTKIVKSGIAKTPADELKEIDGLTVDRADEVFTIKPHDVPVDRTGDAS